VVLGNDLIDLLPGIQSALGEYGGRETDRDYR
jgi:hypothetical protein